MKRSLSLALLVLLVGSVLASASTLIDITGATNEFEVWVDAHTGAILQTLTQPLSLQARNISKQQAEQAALTAVGGGNVVQAQRDQWKGYQIWDIAITRPHLSSTCMWTRMHPRS